MPSPLTQLVRDLVAIDSVNPSLVAGGAGEAQIAAFVAGWAQTPGSRRRSSGRARAAERDRARARAEAAAGRCCSAATSTRSASRGWPIRTPRIDGRPTSGRGAYDMKAGVAAALLACREAARAGLAGDVVVAAVADEEHASLGVQEVLESARRRRDRHRADGARGRRRPQGVRLVEIEVTGRAAHGSRPHLGVDAIVEAGPMLVALGELDACARGAHAIRCSGAGRCTRRRSTAAGSSRATRPAARSSWSAGRCRARRSGLWRPSSTGCSTLPRGRPGARGRAADAARARAVRGRSRTRGSSRAVARRRRRARRAGAAGGASYWADSGVHRGGRDPDGALRAGRRGRPRGRGVGQHRHDTVRRAEALLATAERFCV